MNMNSRAARANTFNQLKEANRSGDRREGLMDGRRFR